MDDVEATRAWMKLVAANQLEIMRSLERLLYEARPIGHSEACQRLVRRCNETSVFLSRWP